MIDICDFAVGLSRQLYGLTIASERPKHRMMEQWHPLGPVLVITAFNFPVAVWAWNAALALSAAIRSSGSRATRRRCAAEVGDCAYAAGDWSALEMRRPGWFRWSRVDATLAKSWSTTRASRWFPRPARPPWDAKLALVSVEGSVKPSLELGGNNAMIVCPTADLALAERAILFSAAGTAGQRCTTLRRLIVHESIADTLVAG